MILTIPKFYRDVLLTISSFLKYGTDNYLPRLVLSFILLSGRLSLRQLGQQPLIESRHKSNVDRLFNNSEFNTKKVFLQLFQLFFHQQELPFARRWIIIFDTTAKKTKRRWHRRRGNGKRGGKRRLRRRVSNCVQYKKRGKTGTGSQANLWVMGLLITDRGIRIPLPRKSYYTKEYARKHGLKYRSQIDIVVEMLTHLNVPKGVRVILLADSFFESKKMDTICQRRNFTYITPVDSHRCLGNKTGKNNGQRVVSLFDELPPRAFTKITLNHSNEQFASFRRDSGHRRKVIYYAYKKALSIANLGQRSVVFSKKLKIEGRKRSYSNKALLTNNTQLTAPQIIELYELRWEIELFFKELKSYLHFADYNFEDFKAAERWVDLVLIAFLLLEYVRLQKLTLLKSSKKKNLLLQARTPQMIEVVRADVNLENLNYLKTALKTNYRRQFLVNTFSKLKLVA